MAQERCYVRLCPNPSVGESPIACQAVCNQHMQADVKKMELAEAAVSERIAYFKKYAEPLKKMHQRLGSELQLLCDSFDDIRNTVDKLQTELNGAMAKQHQEMHSALQLVADTDDFKRELKAAKDTMQLDSRLLAMDSESGQVVMAAFPDVNSIVKDLKASMLVNLKMVSRKLSALDVKNGKTLGLQLEDKLEIKVAGRPLALAVCTNTREFVIDSSDTIVKAQTAPDGRALPQPSIFVAVDSQSVPQSTTKFGIQLVSTDSQDSATLPCSWDGEQPITDLHCDSDRQLLFIAQHHAVTVTDLSGVEHWRKATADIRDDVQKLHCIAGNADKLFVAASLTENKPEILGLSKVSGELELALPVPFIGEFRADTRIAVRDRMLTICHEKKRYKLCTITGVLIEEETIDGGSFMALESADNVSNPAVSKDASLLVTLLAVGDPQSDQHCPMSISWPKLLLPMMASVIHRSDIGCRVVEQKDASLVLHGYQLVAK